jgi:hypothetical protein
MGPDWIEQWAEKFLDWNFEEEMPVPQSLLEFALLNGLFLYARDFLESQPEFAHQLNRQNLPLLFWSIASCKYISATTVLQLWRDESERAHIFAYYLLKQGADPNAVFTIPYCQKPVDDIVGDEMNYDPTLKRGHAEITLLNFALGVIISITDDAISELRIAMLEFICILVENGATTGDTLYTNYWKQRTAEAAQGTILHYLTFPGAHRGGSASRRDEQYDPFKLPDEGPVLHRTIRTLLDHGADPNAKDSEGFDILACMMLSCPYDLIEYALKKGALISPFLLNEDGSPIKKHGILLEERWSRPECYTPEAREMVWKHMPHWEEGNNE